MTARMPFTLLAAIAEPMPAPSMTIPASHLSARHEDGDRLRHVGVVHRIRPSGPEIPDGQPPRPQPSGQSLPESDAGVIAGNRQGSGVGLGHECRGIGRRLTIPYDRDPALAQGVFRERRDMPPCGQRHGLAMRERTRVGLGDDVETFHVVRCSPYGRAHAHRYSTHRTPDPGPRRRNGARRSAGTSRTTCTLSPCSRAHSCSCPT